MGLFISSIYRPDNPAPRGQVPCLELHRQRGVERTEIWLQATTVGKSKAKFRNLTSDYSSPKNAQNLVEMRETKMNNKMRHLKESLWSNNGLCVGGLGTARRKPGRSDFPGKTSAERPLKVECGAERHLGTAKSLVSPLECEGMVQGEASLCRVRDNMLCPRFFRGWPWIS